MADTFDNTTIPTGGILKEMILGSSGATAYEAEIVCRSKTHSDYTTLAAKAGYIEKKLLISGKTHIKTNGGTKGTLVLNGVTYTNCYIESISNAEIPGSQLGTWEFTISFVRDTS